MLGDISRAEHIYIAVGYTDMRKQIDGLSALVTAQFSLDPFSNLFSLSEKDFILRFPFIITLIFFHINSLSPLSKIQLLIPFQLFQF